MKLLGGRVEPFPSDPWSQRDFVKTLGGGVEPLGDELVEDQETVLSLSKKTFLHCTLHCTAAAQYHATEEQPANQPPVSC